MEKIRILKGSVATLVTVPRYLPVIMRPGLGDYDHPYILMMTPCEKVKGKFFDLRTGEEINKKENMLEWNNLSGTVFCYGNPKHNNEKMFLISRSYENGKLILLSIGREEITPCMIPRVVREHDFGY